MFDIRNHGGIFVGKIDELPAKAGSSYSILEESSSTQYVEYSNYSSYVFKTSFNIRKSGSYRLTFDFGRAVPSPAVGYVDIRKNDVSIRSVSIYGSTESIKTITQDINVKKGDVISFYLKAGYYNGSTMSVLIQSVAFKVLDNIAYVTH